MKTEKQMIFKTAYELAHLKKALAYRQDYYWNEYVNFLGEQAHYKNIKRENAARMLEGRIKEALKEFKWFKKKNEQANKLYYKAVAKR